MTDPLVDPVDLGTYLNDDDIDEDRARLMIQLAQGLCESLCSPLPPEAAGVVIRVAANAYTSVLSPRQRQHIQAGSPYHGVMGGRVELERQDRLDLLRMARNANGSTGGGVSSIDILPDGYMPPPSPVGGWYDIGFDNGWYGSL